MINCVQSSTDSSKGMQFMKNQFNNTPIYFIEKFAVLVRLPCLLVQQRRGMLFVESFGPYTKEAGYGVSQGDV